MKKTLLILLGIVVLAGGTVAYLTYEPQTAVGASTAFDNSNWSNYFEITSDNTLVSNSNDNLLYDLSDAPAGFWTTVKSDGGDIRITNSAGDTAYSFELERFDTGGNNGILFFDSSILQTGSDTTWRIYYGNASASLPAADATLGRENVWNTDYVGVYHMTENSGTTMADSTSNGNDGTYGGNLPTRVVGIVGLGQDWASGDYAELPNDLPNSDQYTLSVWGNTDGNLDSRRHLFRMWDTGNSNGVYILRVESDETLNFFARDESSDQGNASGATTNNANHLYHAVYDSSFDLHVYEDGSSDGSDTTSLDQVANKASNDPPAIGSDDGPDVGNDTWVGIIDEVRISTADLSASWISTEYNNQSDPTGFWTTGAEESNAAPDEAPTGQVITF